MKEIAKSAAFEKAERRLGLEGGNCEERTTARGSVFVVHPDMRKDIAQALVDADCVLYTGEISRLDESLRLFESGAVPPAPKPMSEHGWYRKFEKRARK